MARWLPVLLLVACGQDKIGVAPKTTADYNHAALDAAVDKFVAANRTPQAYAELAQTVLKLRPGMDKAVAQEAELKVLVLALPPVQAYRDKPVSERMAALALTVWPTLLAPKIEADALLVVRDPKAPQIPPKPGEDPAQYLERLCGGPFNADCKRVVPEYQGPVVEALAFRHATERVRNALTDCQTCETDPRWKQGVAAWEELDRHASDGIADVERRADPDNWPVSGNAAEDDPGLPEAEVSPHGDLIVDGHTYGPNQLRVDVLRDLRGKADVIELHFHPDTTLAQVRAVLVDARKAGASRVAVVARETYYPWRRHAYWVADGYGMRANLRPTDSLQLLLHAIDEVAGPGTVARVD